MKKTFEKAKNEVLDWTLGILLAVTPLYGYHVLSQKDANTNERPTSAQFQKNSLEKRIEIKSAGSPQQVNYITSDFSKDSDAVLLARMLYGEARNCSDNEKIAIAWTAVNRANDGKKWNGETVRGAILKPLQYSCFNTGDPNRAKLMNPDGHYFERCLEVAEGVLNGTHKDNTKGAMHYHTIAINPKWAESKKMRAKNVPANFKHKFYREN